MINNVTILMPLNDQSLIERYTEIRPITSLNGNCYLVQNLTIEQLKNPSFLWEFCDDIKVNLDDFEITGIFYCHHKDGIVSDNHRTSISGFFRPSVADVLEQMPNCLLEKSTAFIVCDFKPFASKFNAEESKFDGVKRSKIMTLRHPNEKRA